MSAGDSDKETRGRIIQSVDRALEILELLGPIDEMTLTEISARTGIHPSTCHHLLSTLILRGYARRNPLQRTYALGKKMLDLA